MDASFEFRFQSLEDRLNIRFDSLEKRMLQMSLAVIGVQITGCIALGVAIVLKC